VIRRNPQLYLRYLSLRIRFSLLKRAYQLSHEEHIHHILDYVERLMLQAETQARNEHWPQGRD
jgi:hypothetical protein